jgi:tRNA(Ile)-lysidine synthase
VVKKYDWPELALALAERIPKRELHPAVVSWAEGESVAVQGHWALGFSGGADSLALLLLLWAHWPERRAEMRVLHFNHRLRGRVSAAEATFCRRVCAGLGVTLASEAWIAAKKPSGEAAARAARFAFFERVQKRERAPALWLGHQQDDVAETLLMRLARGSGTSGLAALRPVQMMPVARVHVRPLLTLKKEVIVAALTAIGAPWCEDASNATGAFLRNRMRLDVVPAWRAACEGRDALAGAARSRELLEEDDAALETWVDALAPFAADGRLDVRVLAGKPCAVVRRALHRWLLAQADTGDLARQGFEALLAAVRQGRSTRFSLGRTGFAVIRKGLLGFEKGPPQRAK